MKIGPSHASPVAVQLRRAPAVSEGTEAPGGSAGGAQLSVSDGARFLSEIRESARAETVRPEKVEEAKAAIADGSLLSDENIERAIDALLADL